MDHRFARSARRAPLGALVIAVLVAPPGAGPRPGPGAPAMPAPHPWGPAAAVAGCEGPCPACPGLDHGRLDALLRRHVDAAGLVDYAALDRDPAELDAYLAQLAAASMDELGRPEKLALLLNAYNACTIRLILDYWDDGKLGSIMDIPAPRRWDDRRWRVGSRLWSLNELEHEQIRARFKEPRIHFALVCAAASCPALRREAYRGDRLEAQLEDQARRAHADGRWFAFDAQGDVVSLTRLYDWYGDDFRLAADSVLAYAARYAPALREALDAGRPTHIRWLPYHWSLNRQPTDR